MDRTLRVSSSEAPKTGVAVSEVAGARCKRSTVAVAEVAAAMLSTTNSAWADQSSNAATRCMGKSGKTST